MSDHTPTISPQSEIECPQPTPTPAPTPTPTPTSITKARISITAIVALSVAVISLALSLYALLRPLPQPEVEAEEASASDAAPLPPVSNEFITYKKYHLPILDQVPVNSYDTAAFSVLNGRVTYTDAATQAITGVDVSYYQDEIDWKQVKASGVEFAMIRVGGRGYGSSGVIYDDSRFRDNITGALDAGLQVGVYFFSQATNVWEAQEEANFVLNAIKDYNVTFPVVFDWERITKDSARTDGLPGGTITLCAKTFCDIIAQAGYTPMVYSNMDLAYLSYDLNQLKDYGFWLAEYRTTPTFFYHFHMWQYTDKGSVPGINGNVDLNLYFTAPHTPQPK